MCGIAGIIGSFTPAEVISIVISMTDAQTHRGPDDAGIIRVHSEKPVVVFGHRRLAIIDLSPAGHQPMEDPDTGNWITFNGEIYNFRELRRGLESRGLTFRTETDTEVLLKAYAVWGKKCVRHLRGIFAFSIWDSRHSRLFLARDQLGVKPLYYWLDEGVLLFASEVRALLTSGLIPCRLDLNGLRSYLAFGSVQGPLTLVKGVRSLSPGHTMTWQGGLTRTECYWHLPGPGSVSEIAPPDVLGEVASLLQDAIRLQLVSDVPLGAFLSGGIDSTAIAALMQRKASGPVRTFSIVFDEKAYDERSYAKTAARYIGTEHTELLLRGDDVRRSLPEALAGYDQPSMDGLNTYFVSKITREAGLTVALSGVGGDELFGGYNSYRKPLQLERLHDLLGFLPSPLRQTAASALRLMRGGEGMRKLADMMVSPHHPYFISRQVFGPKQIEELLLPEVVATSQDWWPSSLWELERKTLGYDRVNRASVLELQTYMLSTLLRDTDQMSMAHALEVRVPLLDHRLVEYLFTIPGSCKLEPNQPKPLLTRSLNRLLPDECVHRPKRGFQFPFPIWIREALVNEICASLVGQSPSQAAPFTSSGLEGVWRQFMSGRLNWSRVWGVFVLRYWLSEHRIKF